MTIEDSLDFELFDPISKRHLIASRIPYCAGGKLVLVDNDDPRRNNSRFKIYSKGGDYFDTDIACC